MNEKIEKTFVLLKTENFSFGWQKSLLHISILNHLVFGIVLPPKKHQREKMSHSTIVDQLHFLQVTIRKFETMYCGERFKMMILKTDRLGSKLRILEKLA